MSAVLSLALLAGGGGMLWWRPWRDLGGRSPRLVVALVLVSAAALWAGSLGLVVMAVTGEYGGFFQACETLWRKMATGQLAWWEVSLAAVWALAFPGRALVTIGSTVHETGVLQRRLHGAATPVAGDGHLQALTVPSLGTPAITVGLVRPRILVDADFWRDAPPHERSVVLAHENAHRVGRHAIVELAAKALLSPLGPLPAGAAACASLRVHLEALADDTAARTHGRETVGRTLGVLALSEAPTVGLGMAGSSVWRVSRLLTAGSPKGTKILAVLLSSLVLLGVGVGIALWGVTEVLFIATTYCLL